MMTDVTALADPAIFALDATAILNNFHGSQIGAAIRRHHPDAVIICRQRCAGCFTPRELSDHYCAECGADFASVAYQLLTASFPNPANRTMIRSRWSTEQAKHIRGMFARAGVKGVRVTKGKGTGSHHVHVSIPSDRHNWDGQAEPRNDWGQHDCRSCTRCRINQLAEVKAGAMILAAFPDLDDRSDTQSDYFDFVFLVHCR